MHILYTTNPAADVTRFSVRNPHYFAGVERSAEAVTVEGDFPAIVEAYSAAGIDATTEDGVLSDAEQRADLIADLKARGVEFDEASPTDELRALSITPADVPVDAAQEPDPEPAQPQDAPAKRGRKPAQPQE